MRGVVLALVLVPAAIDERVVRTPLDFQAVLSRSRRALGVQMLRDLKRLQAHRDLVRVEPIPLWSGPLPWAFLPPRRESPKPTPVTGSGISLGIVRATFERPSTGPDGSPQPSEQLKVTEDAPPAR